MKTIDNDFETQAKCIFPKSILFVADMHELINPNESARKILANAEKKGPSDTELIALYENSEDPLITAVEDANKNNIDGIIISLGDMVANRVNFGEGTERSIVGKLAKKARESGIKQHEYILQNIEANKQEIQEYAHRNNLWTKMRFQKLDQLLNPKIHFVHLNGNADVISSLVSMAVLPGEKSPLQIFEESSAITRYYKEMPGALILAHYYDGIHETFGGSMCVLIPQALDFSKSLEHLLKMEEHFNKRKLYDLPGKANPIEIEGSVLLIHEALKPDICAKDQAVEGMEVYKQAINYWSPSYVIHGHTHNPEFVEYEFEGTKVIQIPPNIAARLDKDMDNMDILRKR